MKKLSIILTAVVLLFATSAFATGGDNVTVKVKAVFTKKFTGAADVTWQQKNGFYFADFQLNGKTMKAAYDEGGELVGTSQLVSKNQLPAAITSELTKNYAAYDVTGAITQVNFEGKIAYYFSVESKKGLLDLKCSSDGNVDIENKIIK
jgi:uncharacterized protein YxeA